MAHSEFVVMSSGDLYHSRYVPGQGFVWRHVRHTYQQHFPKITNSLELRATIRADAVAWPGGYPLYLVCEDGGCLCFKCARQAYPTLARAWRSDVTSWKVVACEVNWEDTGLTCDHCNEPIPAAYGND